MIVDTSGFVSRQMNEQLPELSLTRVPELIERFIVDASDGRLYVVKYEDGEIPVRVPSGQVIDDEDWTLLSPLIDYITTEVWRQVDVPNKDDALVHGRMFIDNVPITRQVIRMLLDRENRDEQYRLDFVPLRNIPIEILVRYADMIQTSPGDYHVDIHADVYSMDVDTSMVLRGPLPGHPPGRPEELNLWTPWGLTTYRDQ